MLLFKIFTKVIYMEALNETKKARINPRLVACYLKGELGQLKELKRSLEQLLEQLLELERSKEALVNTKGPLRAKTVQDIYVFTTEKRTIERKKRKIEEEKGMIEEKIKCKLQAYNIFDEDESLEKVIAYFEKQFTALFDTKKPKDKEVIDLAYAAQEYAERNHLNTEIAKMGKRVFEPVTTDVTEEETSHAVISSSNSTGTSGLRIEAATFVPKTVVNSTLNVRAAAFMPLLQKQTIHDSIEKVVPKIVTPEALRHSPRQNLMNSSLIFGDPSDLTSSDIQSTMDEPIENGRLYRCYMRP